jgi:hypothetical protein
MHERIKSKIRITIRTARAPKSVPFDPDADPEKESESKRENGLDAFARADAAAAGRRGRSP